jgi:histone H3/H4
MEKQSTQKTKTTPEHKKALRGNLTFLPARVRTYLRKNGIAKRIGKEAPIAATAALEYIAAEIFDLSYQVADAAKRHTIKPSDIRAAIANDSELSKMFAGCWIVDGGQNVHVSVNMVPKPLLERRKQVAKRKAIAAAKQLLIKAAKETGASEGQLLSKVAQKTKQL